MEESLGNTAYEEKEGVWISAERRSFYNPAQEFNRDISVLVMKMFLGTTGEARLLETMSASGIRGIRYVKELDSNVHVFFNDINTESVEDIRKNIALNDLDTRRITVLREDCNSLMASRPCYFDAIDIDPFGSCNVFIENAIMAIKHNGLLAVTATDTAVLCSNEQKCFAKYNTTIRRNPVSHEHALRTVLSFISRTATRHGAGIEPILSISVDFYVRIFVRVVKNKSAAKRCVGSNAFYLICRCLNTVEIPVDKMTDFSSECKVCGARMKLCGPFWSKSMQSREFVQGLKESTTNVRVAGILNTIHAEIDVFGYFCLSDMASFVKCEVASLKNMACAIANAGYDVSITHCKFASLKTTAPLDFVYSAILKNSNRDSTKLNLRTYEISFAHNERALSIRDPAFHRGTLVSHMGPMSKKQRN